MLSPVFSIFPMILSKTCFDKSSTNFKTSLLDATTDRHRHERKYLYSSHRLGSNLDPSGVGGSSDFPKHSLGVGATILVLCDIRIMLCSVTTLRLLSVLHHSTHLVLVVLQTSLGRHPHAGMLCVRQLQL